MNSPTSLALSALPESIMHTHWFAVLSTFVAINTIIYVSLSIFKIMPKLYLNDFVKRHGRRAETRSIYPNGHSPPEDHEPMTGSLAVKNGAERNLVGAFAALQSSPFPTSLTQPTPAGAVRKGIKCERRSLDEKLGKRSAMIGKFPRSYQRWSESEEADLRRRVEAGLTLEEIARFQQRSPSATESRMNRLGLSLSSPVPEHRNDRFRRTEESRNESLVEPYPPPPHPELATTGSSSPASR